MDSFLIKRDIAVVVFYGCFAAALPGAVRSEEVLDKKCKPIFAQHMYDIRVARRSVNLMQDVEHAERVHFFHVEDAMRSRQVLQKPKAYWGELEYMLRRYPNHTRALELLDRLSLMLKTEQVPATLNSVDCHFQRAFNFFPDDAAVKLAYGVYLMRRNRIDSAISMFTEVASLQPNNANNQYNLGLAYIVAKQPEKAREHAILAYGMGFPLPGLKAKLKAAKVWGEAEEAAVKAYPDEQLRAAAAEDSKTKGESAAGSAVEETKK